MTINKRGLTITISLLLALFIVLGTSIHASARTKEDAFQIKYYTSIQVNPGDSLWSIADTYIAGNNKEKQSYVDEICKLNNLDEQASIHSGQYITIYYYSDELK